MLDKLDLKKHNVEILEKNKVKNWKYGNTFLTPLVMNYYIFFYL